VLAAQRQSLILDEVNRLGAVRIADLAAALRVSDMTVRRDLSVLAGAGLVVKVHGGVTAVEPTSAAGGAENRPSGQVTSERAAKEAIAAEAIRLVEPGAAIGVSGGSTTLAFARLLIDVPGIMVVTNSLPLADVLYAEGREDQTVILTGGVRTASGVLVGPVAVETARHLHVDLTFIGTAGMDEQAGFTSSDLLESELVRVMLEAGGRLVVLADHTKWGRVGLTSVARLDDADVLITDRLLPDSGLAVLRSHIATVITA
jgi:DeoR/GlpR family transcriptional regulator of sugar metabolism